LWVLHPDDAFWALLLHVVVDKAAVKTHHADRLVVLSEHATSSGPLGKVVLAACPTGWDAERIIGCVRARDWSTLIALGRMLTRRACIRNPVGCRAGALVRGLHRLGRSLWSVLAERGVSVAVVGSDGASRSALVAGLLSERRLQARHVRRRLAARYHRLRGRTVVVDAHPAAPGPEFDVVVTLEPDRPVTRDVLADAVGLVWRARSGHPGGGDDDADAGARTTRTMEGTSAAATTNCVAR
jgi:hypothetical protein